jgi:hypothetical protein
MFVAIEGEVRAWLAKFIMRETQAMGMNLSQLGNAFGLRRVKS